MCLVAINRIDTMTNITEEQYKAALNRIEELLPITPDVSPEEDSNVKELVEVSNIVWEYENEHFPMEDIRLSVWELIKIAWENIKCNPKGTIQEIRILYRNIFVHKLYKQNGNNERVTRNA